MMMLAIALAAQIERCAPQVAPSTMAAIVRVESGGDSLAIHDNTTRRSYHPRDRADAEAIAQQLLFARHSIDLGIAQINDVNLRAQGLNVQTAFDACANLGAGARILSRDYAFATRRFGAGQVALRHAIGMYNTGMLDAGRGYIRSVLLAAGVTEQIDPTIRVLGSIDPMHSPPLIRVVIAAQTAHRPRPHINVTPSRAPILIRVARTSQVVVFSEVAP
jgi:type IV secretion system protein VirB1